MATKYQGTKYTELLSSLNIGIHPLYEPVLETEMRLGHCGYFDDTGLWVPIALLTDDNQTKQRGLTPIGKNYFSEAPAKDTNWSEVWSTNVKTKKVDADLGATVPASGVPVEGSVNFKLDSGSDFGAVLVTEAPVQVRQMYTTLKPWQAWVAENAEALVEGYKDEIDLYGLWIVTHVWTTNAAYIATLENSRRSVDFALSAGVTGVGKLGPSLATSTASQSGMWKSYTPKPSRWVVSMTGHKIQFKFYFHMGDKIEIVRRKPKSTGPASKPKENGEHDTESHHESPKPHEHEKSNQDAVDETKANKAGASDSNESKLTSQKGASHFNADGTLIVNLGEVKPKTGQKHRMTEMVEIKLEAADTLGEAETI